MTTPNGFTERLVEAIASCDGGPQPSRKLIGRAIADTLAVAAAGFAEPVARASLAAYQGTAASTWSGATCESREAAVFINGTAAHALDFDDVLLDSTLHASTVILPAILEMDRPAAADDLIAAFGAGLVAARAIGRLVGSGHYYKGWHATGTFGALVAAAAAARLHRLDPAQIRSALALAAAQAGGMKLNFGSMAKPCHAGFAATAGLRSVRLALAGVDGAADIFAGPIGFPSLYGTGDGDTDLDDDAFALRPDRVSVKLYPCCTAAHRLIGIALDARDALGPEALERARGVDLLAPAGSLDLLRDPSPRTGLPPKFSARYCVAVALAGGPPTLASFSDAALTRPGLAATLDRVTIHDDPAQQSGGDIEMGFVTLTPEDGSGRIFARHAIPGGPESPPTPGQLQAKIGDCLAAFFTAAGHDFPPMNLLQKQPEIAGWLPEAAKADLSTAAGAVVSAKADARP